MTWTTGMPALVPSPQPWQMAGNHDMATASAAESTSTPHTVTNQCVPIQGLPHARALSQLHNNLEHTESNAITAITLNIDRARHSSSWWWDADHSVQNNLACWTPAASCVHAPLPQARLKPAWLCAHSASAHYTRGRAKCSARLAAHHARPSLCVRHNLVDQAVRQAARLLEVTHVKNRAAAGGGNGASVRGPL